MAPAGVSGQGPRESGRVPRLPHGDGLVADLAIEQAKDVPALYVAEVKKVQARLENVPTVVKTLPEQVKTLRTDVEARVEKATEKATDLYTQLTVRGERLVTQIRRQPSTEAAKSTESRSPSCSV